MEPRRHRGTEVRRKVAIGLVFTAILLFVSALILPTVKPPPDSLVSPRPASPSAPIESATPSTFPGDEILRGYGAPDADIKEDLRQVYTVIDNFQLLAKVDGALPLGSNEEIVSALTGNNPVKLKFLSPGHPAINDNGQLIDRWDTPLFFHALSRDRIEIRSAGPDQTLWTDDDINRRPDGLFGSAELHSAPTIP